METTISIIWAVEDVQSLAPELSNEQAMGVLQNVERNHDASCGVNWETIQAEIDAWKDYSTK
jgi:hypothetical protein